MARSRKDASGRLRTPQDSSDPTGEFHLDHPCGDVVVTHVEDAPRCRFRMTISCSLIRQALRMFELGNWPKMTKRGEASFAYFCSSAYCPYEAVVRRQVRLAGFICPRACGRLQPPVSGFCERPQLQRYPL